RRCRHGWRSGSCALTRPRRRAPRDGASVAFSREEARLATVGVGEEGRVDELLDRRQRGATRGPEPLVDWTRDVVAVDPEEALRLGEVALGERNLDLVLLQLVVVLEPEVRAVLLDGEMSPERRILGIHLPALDGAAEEANDRLPLLVDVLSGREQRVAVRREPEFLVADLNSLDPLLRQDQRDVRGIRAQHVDVALGQRLRAVADPHQAVPFLPLFALEP